MRFFGSASRIPRVLFAALASAGAIWAVSGGTLLAQSRLEQLEAELKARLRASGAGRDERPISPPTVVPGNPEAGYLGLIADDRNETRGVRVLEVVEGGPGADAGIRKNDLLIALNGVALRSMDQLSAAIDASAAGQELTFDVERDGKRIQRLITLGRRPPTGQRRFDDFGRIPEENRAAAAEGRRAVLGVRSQSVKEADRTRLRLPSTMGALVVSVTPDSPAAEAGLSLDDVIVAVDGYVINRPTDLTETIQQLGPGKDVLVSYYRAGRFTRSRALLTSGDGAPIAANVPPQNRMPAELPLGADELPVPSDVEPNRTEAAKPVTGQPSNEMGDKERIELLEGLVGELLNRVDSLEQELKSEREKNGTPAPRGKPQAPPPPPGRGTPGEPVLNPATT